MRIRIPTATSKPRERFVQILCGLLIVGFLYHSLVLSHTRDSKKDASPAADLMHDYNEKVFLFEAQAAVLAKHRLKDGPKEQATQRNDLAQAIIAPLTQDLQQLHPPGAKNLTGATDLQRKKLILSDWLGRSDERQLFCRHLRSASEGQDTELDSLLLSRCSDRSAVAQRSYSAEELEQRLGWFGSLLFSIQSPDNSSYFKNKVYQPAKERIVAFGKIAAVAGVSILGSSICLLILIAKGSTGKLHFRFSKSALPKAYLLEIFTLYLLGMLLLPLLLKAAITQGISIEILPANVIGISCLALAVFWPLSSWRDTAALEQDLGIQSSSWTKTFRDLLSGPFVYFSSISALLVILTVYALLLSFIGIEPGSGAHPVMPLLSRARSSTTIIFIFLLATVVAPVVEELMFRGALYAWLRDRRGPLFSIIVSSVLFAAVHPQGALGIVPLSCIGAILAFLREWRGTITASIAAHCCFNAGTLLLALQFFR